MHLKGHEGKLMQSGVFENQQCGSQWRNINSCYFGVTLDTFYSCMLRVSTKLKNEEDKEFLYFTPVIPTRCTTACGVLLQWCGYAFRLCSTSTNLKKNNEITIRIKNIYPYCIGYNSCTLYILTVCSN